MQKEKSTWVCLVTRTSDADLDRGWPTTHTVDVKSVSRAGARRAVRKLYPDVSIHSMTEWKPGQFAEKVQSMVA